MSTETLSTSALTNYPAQKFSRGPMAKPWTNNRSATKSLEHNESLHSNFHRLFEQITNLSTDLEYIDSYTFVQKVVSSLPSQVDENDLQQCLIQTSAMMIGEEPQYSKLAARILSGTIETELQQQGIFDFADSIAKGVAVGLIHPDIGEFVQKHKEELNATLISKRDHLFEYFGLRTVYDRYLLKDPQSRKVIECPQYFFMRVACGLSYDVEEAKQFYLLISSFEYMCATPTLFNSGTRHPQMSSCYLLDSPQDSLEAIYGKYTDIALLSKFAGGIGVAFSKIRSRGSLIKGTNGKSNGIVPFLKTLDSSISAVNQGGKRKGAACVYLETWHADILEFLSLRDNTGDEALRTHNLNLANWIPDLFMERVEKDEIWSLFDPKEVPHFTELYGEQFEKAYSEAEKAGLAKKQMPARELYATMIKTLAQTGNGWMTFKDASNLKANQTLKPENVIHLSNLCTEILEVTSEKETAVCNLGSINLAHYLDNEANFDFARLAKNVQTAVKFLDRVVDINFYPINSAGSSNSKWRPIGLGLMGLQNLFFAKKLPFDSEEAIRLSAKIQEEIYYNALLTSLELAKKHGPHPSFKDTRASLGQLQFDLWGITPSDTERWDKLRAEIKVHGLRNSLLIAIAPTATIASITGSYECIEPQLSNLFKRETLSGEFLQVNPYLVQDLRKLGLWNDRMRQKIKLGEGSIQHIPEIPEELRSLYRTVWEIPQKALIDHAAQRGPYIDQSQSLNLFLENPTLGKLSSMYAYVWKTGLKTSYYFRSRGATRINKSTVAQQDVKLVACSLENPQACESCM